MMGYMTSSSVNIVAVYRALGDEIRLGMVRLIANSEQPIASRKIVSSCTSVTVLTQPSVSHHFSKHVSSGIVRETKKGAQKLYEIDYDVLRQAGVDINTIK